ncbi:MAG: amidophosphoribosyltransferase [Solirubrobacterales bacterium]|jgi:glutamate synthase domain-containing protein 1|nr:amidophosphoribosyltransferase [Solirubrobacterales bacterium]
MCGIVGIFSKSPGLSERLGEHLARMLVQMGDRGPDSAGAAIYRDPVAQGAAKLSLYSADDSVRWDEIEAAIGDALGVSRSRPVTARHRLVEVEADPEPAQAWVEEHLPGLRVMSAGRTIEMFKEAVTPARFVQEYGIAGMTGSHAIAHTRMATESRVTTQGSHPFSTGRDLCLVHNGSLSNHNRLRQELRREGIGFQTDNDTEVAAGYLTWRMREGATLEEALEGCLEDLDGFYTFAVGTADGFAVLRDPIACKPAVMAETDDYVAIASEYRALADLPGAADAEVWEPSPGVVYSWGAAVVGG